MKSRILAACVLAACACVPAGAAWAAAQESKPQQPEIKLSGGERDAVEKIKKAKGIEAQLQAASEFVKKYPQSAARPQVASYLAGQVAAVTDAAQKASLTEVYISIFNLPAEIEPITPFLIDAYLNSKQADEAFRVAAGWLARNPDDVRVLARLALVGVNEVNAGNAKLLQTTQQYGVKAVELFEADKRPADMADAQWQDYKRRTLIELYIGAGALAMRAGNMAQTKAQLEKAAALKSPNPSVYAVLGQLANADYETMVSEYKVAPEAQKDAKLKAAQAQLDKVIELYAQTVALAEGSPQHKPLTDQLRPALENYYKYRNNGSTAGLEQLIAKYRPAPATP